MAGLSFSVRVGVEAVSKSESEGVETAAEGEGALREGEGREREGERKKRNSEQLERAYASDNTISRKTLSSSSRFSSPRKIKLEKDRKNTYNRLKSSEHREIRVRGESLSRGGSGISKKEDFSEKTQKTQKLEATSFGEEDGLSNNVPHPPDNYTLLADNRHVQIQKLESKLEEVHKKLERRNEKYEILKSENEELLVALAERALQVTSLKKELGIEDSSDEDESSTDQQNNHK